jgi:hypothetical protein
MSLRNSENKGARHKIQIVFNKTILKDYFKVYKSILSLLIFKLTSLKVGKKRNLTKKRLSKIFDFWPQKRKIYQKRTTTRCLADN